HFGRGRRHAARHRLVQQAIADRVLVGPVQRAVRRGGHVAEHADVGRRIVAVDEGGGETAVALLGGQLEVSLGAVVIEEGELAAHAQRAGEQADALDPIGRLGGGDELGAGAVDARLGGGAGGGAVGGGGHAGGDGRIAVGHAVDHRRLDAGG